MRKLLCSSLFSALALGAAELTGRWSGSFDITTPNGETKADSAYMDLKKKGGEVTGTAGLVSRSSGHFGKGSSMVRS